VGQHVSWVIHSARRSQIFVVAVNVVYGCVSVLLWYQTTEHVGGNFCFVLLTFLTYYWMLVSVRGTVNKKFSCGWHAAWMLVHVVFPTLFLASRDLLGRFFNSHSFTRGQFLTAYCKYFLTSTYPYSIWRPQRGRFPEAIEFLFGVGKLEWLGYNVVKVAWWSTQSFG